MCCYDAQNCAGTAHFLAAAEGVKAALAPFSKPICQTSNRGNTCGFCLAFQYFYFFDSPKNLARILYNYLLS